jgi:hypothetical protein
LGQPARKGTWEVKLSYEPGGKMWSEVGLNEVSP